MPIDVLSICRCYLKQQKQNWNKTTVFIGDNQFNKQFLGDNHSIEKIIRLGVNGILPWDKLHNLQMWVNDNQELILSNFYNCWDKIFNCVFGK